MIIGMICVCITQGTRNDALSTYLTHDIGFHHLVDINRCRCCDMIGQLPLIANYHNGDIRPYCVVQQLNNPVLRC